MKYRFPFFSFLAAVLILVLACKSGPAPSAPSAKDDAAAAALKVERLERLLGRRAEAANALDALEAALPERTWLVEVSYEPGQVRVKGRARTNALLADYITRLGQSPAFTDMTLGGSVLRNVGGRESQEFALDIALVEPTGESVASGAGADPAGRLQELEKKLPARGDPAGVLREVQGIVRDAGLQMTRFAPGAEASGELAAEVPIAIEVSGDRQSLSRCLRGLADSPGLWIVERLSLKAASPDDPRSELRAAITARAYSVR